MFRWITALFVLFGYVSGAFEGESCVKDGVVGVCKNINNCLQAQNDIKNRINRQLCSFSGADPIVCCVSAAPTTTTSKPVATTSTARPNTTTEYVPLVYDYEEVGDRINGCVALSIEMSGTRTGQKAWDKCLEYQERYVFPCENSTALGGGLTRVNHCHHNPDELIVGGVNAAKDEFPHMVLLGFGDNIDSVQWLCGGSIISEKFVLTAGHCTFERTLGAVTYVAVNRLKRSDPVDKSKVYKISRIIKHPDYKSPIKYNDIALLETETAIHLDQFVVPACLHIGNEVKDETVIATGWGAIEYLGNNADVLQKVKLTKFTHMECATKFPASRLMKQGVNQETQVCYGDYKKSKDSCQGDSGGPIQMYNNKIFCMYTVIGVTSFGKACGYIGDPGIYTRVASFVPWIESIVWP